MKRQYLYLNILLLPLLILAVMSCRSGSKQAPGSIDQDAAGEIIDQIEAVKQVYHLCPSPGEMLGVIDMEDLHFKGDLLNPPGNADKYLDTRARTIALGIYITDLAYAALFGRHEETLDYLEVVKKVAEQIRLTGAVNEELIQNARDNVESLDSLFDISNQAFINMLTFCERDGYQDYIMLLSAGAFVESLFLTINLVDDYDDAGYLITHIAEQKFAIENLQKAAESMAGADENVAAILEEMRPVIEIYGAFASGAGGMSIKTEPESGEGQPKKLVIGGGESAQPTLNREQFEMLKSETIKLRSELIEG